MNELLTLGFVADIDHWFGQLGNNFLNATNGFFTPILKIITSLGNFGLVFIIISFVMLFFVKTRKAGTVAIGAMFLGLLLSNILLKNVVARPRPFTQTESDFFLWWQAAGSLPESGYSFPSGHTTAATAFSFSMFLCFNKKSSWLYLLIPFLIGFTRIYFMVHYSTDVIMAMVVGIICSVSSFFIIRQLLKLKPIEKLYNLPSVVSLFKKKAE